MKQNIRGDIGPDSADGSTVSCPLKRKRGILTKTVASLVAFVLVFGQAAFLSGSDSSAFADIQDPEPTSEFVVDDVMADDGAATVSEHQVTVDDGSAPGVVDPRDAAAPEVLENVQDADGTTPTSDFAGADDPLQTEQVISTTAGDGTVVTVYAASGVLPVDATVEARVVDEPEIVTAVEDKVMDDGGNARAVKAYDVVIRDHAGNEVQPSGPVRVSFTKTGISGDDVSVYHVSDDATAVEEMTDRVVSEDTQEFVATHFSIYAIVDTGTEARIDVVFNKVDGTGAAHVYVKRTDDLNQIIYDPGAGTMQNGWLFRGWTEDAGYTTSSTTLDIAGVRTMVGDRLNGAFSDGDQINLYPAVFKAMNIVYLDENNATIDSDTVLTSLNEPSVSYTVDKAYTPPTPNQNFEGWNVNSGGSNIDGFTPGTLYTNGTEITISGNVTFSVNAPEGHWLVFDENGKGATYNAPEFVKQGETTYKPVDDSEMTRLGYTFGGWYTDAACTDGNEFTFGNPLIDNTTIYAKWIPNETAGYTVIIWKQNVSGDGYDFGESITLSGTVGNPVAVSSTGTGNNSAIIVDGTTRTYHGFHLNAYDQGVTINTEGTSLVNVYYDRNLVTLTFYLPNTSTTTPYQTMSGLFGSTLAENGYTWPSNYWWYSSYMGWRPPYQGTGTRTTFMDAFIPPTGYSMNFYGFTGNGSSMIRFYKQNTDGGYDLANQVSSTNATFNISDKYNGYKAASYSVDGVNWTALGEKDPNTGYYASVSNYTNLHIRFDRLQYNLLYQDGVYIDGNGNPVQGYSSRGQLNVVNDITYGADMTSYDVGGADYYTPTYEGFVFEGWYADSSCTHPYTFTTMSQGITVYAKWRQIQYRVFLRPNAGTDTTLDWGSESQQLNFRINYGDKISAPTGLREDYEFVGWYLDPELTKPFNEDAFVLNDTTVTTPYDMTLPENMTDVMDKWGNGATYNKDLENNRFWITRKLDLYGKWRAKLTGATGIGIVYNADAGTNAPSDTLLYLDQASAVAGAASTPSDPAKQFAYWVVQDWNEETGAYEDTDVVVFPGGLYTVLKDNAKVVENEGSTPEDPSFTYTVQLRAEYVDKGSPTTTRMIFDANQGTFAGGGNRVEGIIEVNREIDVPSAPTRWGYNFLGWAAADDATVDDILLPQTTTRYAADNLDGLAWDEAEQANILYAVWVPVPVTLSLQKEITGPQADLAKKFDFTVSCMVDGVTYEATARLGDTDGSLGDGESVSITELAAPDGTTHVLRYGDTVTIVEAPAPGYTTSHQVLTNALQGGSTATVTLANSDTVTNVTEGMDDAGNTVYFTKVVFTNDRQSIVVTGVKAMAESPLPLILIASVLLATASVAITRRRRSGWRE